MNTKLPPLVAGALVALILAVFPPIAAAGSFTATCSSGLSCSGVLEITGTLRLEESTGLAITCTGATGSASQTSGVSTGTAELTMTGCKESVLGTQCNSTGTSGQIRTNKLTTDLIYIEPNKSAPGILYTGVNVTYSCPVVGLKKTVTGSIIDTLENPQCGVARSNHTTVFEFGALSGSQKHTQATTTGTVYDLITNNDAGGAYNTSAIGFTLHVNWPAGILVTLNC